MVETRSVEGEGDRVGTLYCSAGPITLTRVAVLRDLSRFAGEVYGFAGEVVGERKQLLQCSGDSLASRPAGREAAAGPM